MDIVGKRWWFFALSALIILPGIIFLIIPPSLKLGIDFTGGSSISVTFTEEVFQEDLRVELDNLGYSDALVQSIGENSFFVRTKELGEAEKNRLIGALDDLAPLVDGKEDSFDFVSGVVARETIRNSIIAVVVASIGILIFITWAFRSVPSSYRYGVGAIFALVHDMLVVLGVFAIMGQFLDVEVNAMFILGLLVVLGYSVNDTIVVFDRIRENINRGFTRDLATIVNVSIMETIGRSLNTSLTLLFTLMALYLFGGATIRNFLLVLIIGVVVGTYSSIGIASQILIIWEKREVSRILRRLPLPLRARGG